MTSTHSTLSTPATANTTGSDHFRNAVDTHARWVFASAYRQLHDRQLAEDAAQTVFLLLFRRPHLMRSPNLSGWLFNTLQYTIKNLRRSKRRRLAREAKLLQASPTTPDPIHHIDLADQLDCAVATLSSTDRAAILLRFYQDLSFEQIAQSLNISEPAAKKRVTRAITSLRHHFNKTGAQSLSDAALSLAALHGLSLAPASLTTSITTTAGSAILPVTIAASLKGATTLMAITKLQSAALITLTLGILAIPTTLLILHATSPAPTPPVATAPSAPETYLSYYALAPNEPFKIVNAPSAFRADMYTALQSPQTHPIDAPDAALFFDWNAGSPQNPLLVAQKQFPLAQAVIQLSALALNLKPDQIQLNTPIPNTLFTVPGDLVYDSTRAPEQVIPALETAFRTQMKLNLKLSITSMPQDVYVLTGNWKYAPVANEEPATIPQFNGKAADPLIEIYGSPIFNPAAPKPGQGLTSDSDGLATQISEWIQHPVVINGNAIPHQIGWRWNDSAEHSAESERLAHDPAAVLNHITEQTGLTWKKSRDPSGISSLEKSTAVFPAPSPDDYLAYYSLAPGEVMKLLTDVLRRHAPRFSSTSLPAAARHPMARVSVFTGPLINSIFGALMIPFLSQILLKRTSTFTARRSTSIFLRRTEIFSRRSKVTSSFGVMPPRTILCVAGTHSLQGARPFRLFEVSRHSTKSDHSPGKTGTIPRAKCTPTPAAPQCRCSKSTVHNWIRT